MPYPRCDPKMHDIGTIDEKRHTNPKKPEWAIAALEDFHAFFQNVDDVLHLSIRGLSMIEVSPAITNFLNTYHQIEPEKAKARLEFDQRQSQLARQEIDSGFRLLHAQAVVSLWGGLECAIQDTVASWILNQPQRLLSEPWASLKIRLADYEPLSPDRRASYLVGHLEQNRNAAFRKGVQRFEQLLEAVGLDGPVDEQSAQGIFELQQVRNVIVHRRAVADMRLCTDCPWLGLSPGQRLHIDHTQYRRLSKAVTSYFCELVARSAEAFGDKSLRHGIATRPLSD